MLQQQQHRVHDQRLDGLDGAEQDHAELRDDLVVVEVAPGSFATAEVIEPSGARRTRASSARRSAFEPAAGGVGAALRLGIAVVDHRAGERVVEGPDPATSSSQRPRMSPATPIANGAANVALELAFAGRPQGREKRVDPVRDRRLEPSRTRACGTARRRATAGGRARRPARQHHHAERRATRFGSAHTENSSRAAEHDRASATTSPASRPAPAPTTRARPRGARSSAPMRACSVEVVELDGRADREPRGARRLLVGLQDDCGTRSPVTSCVLQRPPFGCVEPRPRLSSGAAPMRNGVTSS